MAVVEQTLLDLCRAQWQALGEKCKELGTELTLSAPSEILCETPSYVVTLSEFGDEESGWSRQFLVGYPKEDPTTERTFWVSVHRRAGSDSLMAKKCKLQNALTKAAMIVESAGKPDDGLALRAKVKEIERAFV